MALFWLHLASTLALVGLIWTIQLVHYPLMARVGADFVAYHSAHCARIAWLVAPLMGLEADLRCSRSAPGRRVRDLGLVGIGLVALIWIATALLSVLEHSRLQQGFDAAAVERLVRTNWIRTVAWTVRGVLVVGSRPSGSGPPWSRVAGRGWRETEDPAGDVLDAVSSAPASGDWEPRSPGGAWSAGRAVRGPQLPGRPCAIPSPGTAIASRRGDPLLGFAEGQLFQRWIAAHGLEVPLDWLEPVVQLRALGAEGGHARDRPPPGRPRARARRPPGLRPRPRPLLRLQRRVADACGRSSRTRACCPLGPHRPRAARASAATLRPLARLGAALAASPGASASPTGSPCASPWTPCARSRCSAVWTRPRPPWRCP